MKLKLRFKKLTFKKFLIAIAVFFLFLGCSFLFSCATTERIELHDIAELDRIYEFNSSHTWDYAIFPEEVKPETVEDFHAYYTYEILKPTVEIFLAVQYDENTFSAEVERIQSIKGYLPIKQNASAFSLPSYVTTLGCSESSAYVLLDNDTYKIYYVYLQFIRADDIQMDAHFLPENYTGYGNVDGFDFSIFYDNAADQYIGYYD